MNKQVIYYHGHRYTRRSYRWTENNRQHIAILAHRWERTARHTRVPVLISERTVWHSAPHRLDPSDAGCWVDGHWGQYGVAHMVNRAEELGYDDAEVIDLADRHLASMGPSTAPELSDDEHEALSEASDEVEAWLNEHVTPEGYYFGWWEGEFFLWSDEQWEED